MIRILAIFITTLFLNPSNLLAEENRCSEKWAEKWDSSEFVSHCAELDFEIVEKIVDIEYQRLLKILPKKVNTSSGILATADQIWLKKAQKAWRIYVDTDCGFGPSVSGGEWGYVNAKTNLCRVGRFEERARNLKGWRLCIEGDGNSCD